MDLKGLFLYSSPGQSIMAMFSSGAGLEVRGHGGKMLSLTALLPETFLNQTEGLFGLMNGQRQDDLTLPNGTALDVASSGPREHFVFGADWAITNETSLFTYDTQDLLHDFVHGPKHNSSFVPVFSPPQDADASLLQQAAALCHNDPFCRFDVLTTGDLAVGNITRLSHHRFRDLQYNLRPVVSCSWLPPPSNGVKDGTHYLAGSELRFRCHPGYRLMGLTVTRCQVDGTWTGHTPDCVPNGGASLPLPALAFAILKVAFVFWLAW